MILTLTAVAPIRVSPPPLPLAIVGSARNYRVVSRKVPFDDGTTAFVRGRSVRFKNEVEGWNRVQVEAVGRDGTVLLQRACVGGPRWTIQDFIVHGRKETPVLAFGQPADLTGYVDAHHYLAAYHKPGEENVPPIFVPPLLLVVDGERKRVVGRGDPVSWAPGREVVATVPQPDRVSADGSESESVVHTWIFANGRTYDLGALEFCLRMPCGISVFGDDAGGLWTWDRGHLNAWTRLPSGWKPVLGDTRGELLVQKDDGWAAGILRGTILASVHATFAKAVGEDWLETRWMRPDGSFRVYASDRLARTEEFDFIPR